MTPIDAYQHLTGRIHSLRIKDKQLRLFGWLSFGFSLLIFALLVLVFLESIFWFPASIRTRLFYGTLLFVFLLLFSGTTYCIRRFLFDKHWPSDDLLSGRIGKTFPPLRDRLMNSMQVYRNKDLIFTSSELAEASLLKMAEESKSCNFLEAVNKRFFVFGLRSLSVAAGISLLLLMLCPSITRETGTRLLHPRTVYVKPQPFHWIVKPGNHVCVRGDTLTIHIDTEGQAPPSGDLILQLGERREAKSVRVPGTWTLEDLRNSLTYFVKSGSVQSDKFEITVRNRPVIRRLTVSVFPPRYSGLSAYNQDANVGNIVGLYGSRVAIRFTSSKPVGSATLHFENRLPLSVQTYGAEGRGSFILRNNDTYSISIMDTDSLTNSNPIVYDIKTTPDQNPVARIRFPAQIVDLDENMKLPLELEAEDDFGLSVARIGYSILRGGDPSPSPDTLYHTISADTLSRHFHQALIWDVDAFGMWPEDVISYFFEVWDNDAIRGPKPGRSETHKARFPSMTEIFEEVTDAQDTHIDAIESFLREQDDLKKMTDQMAEDFKAGREITWEKQQQLSEALDGLQLEQKIEALEQQLHEISDRLERNNLISVETLEKYSELQELYQEMSTPEMRQAMEEFQKALQNMDENTFREAMQNMQINQEMLKQSIERTLALLKQIRVEQKMEALANQLNEMAERQTAINEALNRQNPDHDQLAADEQKLSEDAANVEQEMEDLAHKMREIPKAPMEAMESLMDSMKSDPLSQQTQKMESLLQQQNPQSRETGSQIAQSMMSISQSIQQMQAAMENQRQQQSREGLQKTSFQLLQISQKQETLMQQMQQGATNNPDATESQAAMISGVRQVSDSLYQLSRQNFQLSPELGQSLSRAQNQMEQAARAMQQFGNRGVEQHQTIAMGALNEAAAQLQDALEQMQQCGGGMEQFMMQLGQMGQQQMSLHRQLMDMLNQGAMSLQQQAGMARMAAQQRALHKQLENMMRGMGERSDIAGRLGTLAKEMEEVIKDLEANQASSKTIRRQKKIISRLLDAQHSLYKQDMSRQRKATAGRDIQRRGPGPLKRGLSDWESKIREELLRLKDAGYTQDYQKLIRDYFDALTREPVGAE